jgi:hypothetical protein
MNRQAIDDKQYWAQRHMEMQMALRPFRQKLEMIYNYAPQQYRINIDTGESCSEIAPEWQAEADKVKAQMEEYVRINFPEFTSYDSPHP